MKMKHLGVKRWDNKWASFCEGFFNRKGGEYSRKRVILLGISKLYEEIRTECIKS